MKLHTLFKTSTPKIITEYDDFYPEMVTPKHKKHIDNISKNPKNKHLGSGANAFVYNTIDDQQVNTVHRSSVIEDGCNLYLQNIYNNPTIHNNPFVPKVIQIPKNLNNPLPTYTLEKLTPLYSPALDNLTMVRTTLFNNFQTPWISELQNIINSQDKQKLDKFQLQNDLSKTTNMTTLHYTMAKILHMINAAAINNDMTNIKNKQLIQAIQFIIHTLDDIKQLPQYKQSRIDIHQSNVMWRLSNSLPQLVIVDPIHTER